MIQLDTENDQESYNMNPHQQEQQEYRQLSSRNLNSIDYFNNQQDYGFMDELINSLQISNHNRSQLEHSFQSETMVPLKYFLDVFQKMIRQQQIQEGENDQYKYMKENMMRILIQSLRIYCKKGGILNLEPFFYEFIQNENNFSHQNLKKIFCDPVLCDQIQDFVRDKFDDNIPEGTFGPLFFKQCWEDYAHCQQRIIDKRISHRQDLTLYNKIYRWDTVYKRTMEQILRSPSLSNINLSNQKQIQRSSVIIKYDLIEYKELIKQIAKEDHQLELIQNQIKYYKQNLKKLQKIYLQKQIKEGINLNQILTDFHLNLHKGFIQSKSYKCSKEKIVELYLSDVGRDYLQKYVEDGQIIQYLDCDKQQHKKIEKQMTAFKRYLDKAQRQKININKLIQPLQKTQQSYLFY